MAQQAAVPSREAIPGEFSVAQYGVVTLTNHRVNIYSGGSGSSRYRSMTLDSIASCGFVTETQPVLIVFAILAAIAGTIFLSSNQQDAGVAGIVSAIVFAVLYFATRSSALTIASNGGERIVLNVSTLEPMLMMNFIDAVERTKLVALGRIR